MIGSVTVEGFKELDEALKSLDPELDPKADRIVGRGLKAAAGLLVAAARPAINSVTGQSAANLKVRPGPRRKGYRSYFAGVSLKWYTGDQFYFAFVEFGHKQGNRKLGDSREEIPGEHALEYTFDETADAALELMGGTIIELIENAQSKRAGGTA